MKLMGIPDILAALPPCTKPDMAWPREAAAMRLADLSRTHGDELKTPTDWLTVAKEGLNPNGEMVYATLLTTLHKLERGTVKGAHRDKAIEELTYLRDLPEDALHPPTLFRQPPREVYLQAMVAADS